MFITLTWSDTSNCWLLPSEMFLSAYISLYFILIKPVILSMSLSSSRHVTALSIWYSMTQTASYTTGTRSFWTPSDCRWVPQTVLQENTKPHHVCSLNDVVIFRNRTMAITPRMKRKISRKNLDCLQIKRGRVNVSNWIRCTSSTLLLLMI